jgi:hypothetical protein
MTPALKIPAALMAAFGATLSASLESAVRGRPTFLSSFDENKSCSFGKFEIPAFK